MVLKLGVIGFGNIAKAIITPLLDSKLIQEDEICCLVKTQKSCEKIKTSYNHNLKIFSVDSPEAKFVWDSPVKLLSVKPQQLHAINEIKNLENNKKDVIVSILAGVSIENLRRKFPNHKCTRAVTNIPITIGKGLTGIAWGELNDDNQKKFINSIFANSSKVYEFSEDMLDPFLALTSSGPAIIALIIEALGDGGLSVGIPKKLADELILEMILGTVLFLKGSQINTSILKNMVTSPGGTTISALRILENKSVRSALIESIIAATNKSKEFH